MSNITNEYDLAIIGGGAAGIFAAINARTFNQNAKICIVEKTNKFLSKVKISGGGRCNVTHDCREINQLVKNYPRGSKELLSVFYQFNVNHTIDWFKERGVFLKTEEDGRMFPVSDSSETIINCFMSEISKYKIPLYSNFHAEIAQSQIGFLLTNKITGEIILSKKLLICAGGNSNENSYHYIQKLKHKIIKPIPSLFTFNLKDKTICKLMGVSVKNAEVKIIGVNKAFSGPLLITHWGFSGPAVLKLSAFAAPELHALNYNYSIKINWLEGENRSMIENKMNEEKLLAGNTKWIKWNKWLPARLWEYLLIKAEINPQNSFAETSKKQINKLIECLFADVYEANGKTTFKEEFVTCGGVDLKEIDFKTMESKKIKGLFFAGEVINVDGITGGFNFQAAWSTAFVAAKNCF